MSAASSRWSIGCASAFPFNALLVADRGMISAETIAELEARGLCYILGVRERNDKLVRDLVLADPAPFIPLTIAKRGKEIDYEAKAVTLRAALHRLSQSRRNEEGRRRQNRDPGRAQASAQERR